MTTLTFLGDFPQVALAIAFSLGCALLAAFIFLRVVVGLVTREQYNVTDAPRRIRVLVWMGHGNQSDSVDQRGSRAARQPYLLPAAAAPNRFARIPKSGDAGPVRCIQFPERIGGGISKGGTGDGGAA